MKKTLLLATAALASTVASQAAITFTNGNFENTTPTFPTGWTVTGAPTAVSGIVAGSTTAANLANGQNILQDFAATTADGLANFQVDFAFRLSAETQAHRIRLEGNNGNDLLSMSITANGAGASTDSINAFNSATSTLVSAFGGLTIDANTTYYMRVIGSNFGTASRSYTLGLSSDGVNYTTSAPVSFFHGSTQALVFETITFEGGGTAGTNFTIDNVTVVPEPTVALLGGLGLLGLLRRRR